MIQKIKKDKNKIVLLKQANKLNLTGNSLTSTQKKIIYMVQSQFRDDAPDRKIYKISVKEFENLTGRKTGYTHLKKSAEELKKQAYTIFTENSFTHVTAIVGAASHIDKGEGIIEIEISEEIRPYFFDLPDNFTLFQLKAAMLLQSKYSNGIYEMLSQFKEQYKIQRANNEKCIINISVQELKRRFKLFDPETGYDKYPNFGVFAQNVLNPAHEEINNITEIRYDCETKKTGRKVTDLRFIITEIIEELVNLPKSDPETPKILPTSNQESHQPLSMVDRLRNECGIDLVLAKKVVKTFPAEEIEWVMNGILKMYEQRKIENLAAYSTKLFTQWLNGAKPTFENSETPRKYKSPKSASQKNQIEVQERMGESEIINKLKFKFKLNNEEIYGFVYHYAAELESLGKLEATIRKIENWIDEGKINEECILEKLEEQLNVELKKFNNELIFILVILYENFGLGSIDVRNLVRGHSIESLKPAIVKVNEELKSGQISKVKHIILQRLYEILNNGKVNLEVKHLNRPLFVQSDERLNSTNSLGNILASSIKKPNIQAESSEDEKTRKEKTEIWKRLIGLSENMIVEEIDRLVEEFAIEALKFATSKVVEDLRTHKIPNDSNFIENELRKHAYSWNP